MIKLLHSFPDKENKFKEYCRLTFEIDELENTYTSHLSAIQDISDYDVVILHYLRLEDCTFLLNQNVATPIIWFCWGADIFRMGKFYNKFLFRKTRRLRDNIAFKNLFKGDTKKFFRTIFPFLIDFGNYSLKRQMAINKIDYMVPVMPGDYQLLRDSYDVKISLHHLNYVNPLIEKEEFDGIKGENILLGNSSSFSNNHIEAIDQLRKIDLENRKIIIPLSYGDEELADYIDKYANKKLDKDRVIILKDFIPFSKYNEILNSCEIVIMNHQRQQAVGNIVQSLINGSHLYLREESTVYQFLVENRFKVSSFNEAYHLEGLSDEDILFNRDKAKEIFGAQTQHKKLLVLMDKVLNQ